ncbi:MAG: hypothetical protein ACLQVI_03105, partial [Polyangiaceae bacterium]
GAFLFEQAEALAPELGSSPEDLRASEGMPDEVVAPRLRARLGRRREVDRERQALEDTELAMRAATVLGRTARWTEHGAVLDTDLLLGDVLVDREKKYVTFKGEDFTVAVERDTLARAAMVRRIYLDVAACVDADGLHVRWRGGRGGYNWKPRFVAPADRERVLTVALPPLVRAAVPRPGAWLGDLLVELGYAV